MEYITLKNSPFRVSRLCMGGCPMGRYGWGDVNEDDLIKAVHTAIDNGINIFDTADTYGLGQSEITLGKALKTGSRNREEVIIADKFGVRAGHGKETVIDNSPDYIRSALDVSLKRLGTDYIDLYQVHYRDKITPLCEVIGTLEELKAAGKIRYYGLSNIHEPDYEELKPFIGQVVNVQNEYSLACRKNEDNLETLNSTYQLTPFTWGSLGQGILTGKYTKDNIKFGQDDRRSRAVYVNFYGEKLEQNLKIVETMKPIAEEHQVPISAVAIRFILDWLKESVVLVGAKKPGQIEDNIKSMDWILNMEELTALDAASRQRVGGGGTAVALQ